MEPKKTIFRQNKNFLSKPTFILDESRANIPGTKAERIVWAGISKYTLETEYKLPVKTDQIVLYFLLLKCQQSNWATKLQLSRYEILKECGIKPCGDSYERLEDTLNRLKKIHIKFHGSFTEVSKKSGVKYITASFGIIDSWQIISYSKQPGKCKVRIRLSEEFIETIRCRPFYQTLDFEHFKTLKNPSHFRLYEILVKNFYDRNTWNISAMNLAKIIPLKVRWPSDLIGKIKPALKKINKVIHPIKLTMITKKNKKGETILYFRMSNPESTHTHLSAFDQGQKSPNRQPNLPGFDTNSNECNIETLTALANNLLDSTADKNDSNRNLKEISKREAICEFPAGKLSKHRYRKTAKKQVVELIKNMLEQNDVEGLKQFQEFHPSYYAEAVDEYQTKSKK
jgi:hypothetical protein